MSNTRNGLLAQIVQASGGTVTDASNRNSLLQDWLNAVSGPVGRWYFNLNGVDQYVGGFDVQFPSNFWLKTTFSTTKIGTLPLIGSDNETQYLIQLRDTQFRLYFAQGATNRQYNLNGLNLKDGAPHTVELIVLNGDAEILIDGVSLGSQDITPYTGVNNFNLGKSTVPNAIFEGRIYNYSDSLGNILPLDDSFANNPTARNTGSGANATYINATEASWSFE